MTVSPASPAAPTVAVIVVAAGSGTRLGHAEPKAFVLLHMRPLLDHALDSIFGMNESVQVVVVVPGDRVADAHALAARAAARHGAPASAGPG
ncbi:2-C-methyl-D-erythritol 4-phosphate cytidylyltransferase, partial [Cryobacterium sp. TMT1-3]|uniref:2-C-methyl-D-erythritol 4-phosphate cytidylyltransferase n=1 Tax=Cryobacterium sp. TMT1-3 TaxID=1259237 RepID=UPI001103E488